MLTGRPRAIRMVTSSRMAGSNARSTPWTAGQSRSIAQVGRRQNSIATQSRLAERSKASAADIAKVIEGAQAESNATVVNMERSARQMQEGLSLLGEVADATARVRLTTQQQRSATEQVVVTMEQVSSSSG